jgi:BirA family biotin operon repressor/biotin-[acetyl-CoA-carboxylase] ligase
MTRTAISPRLAIRIFFSTDVNVGGVTRTPGIDRPDEPRRPWHVSAVAVTGSTNDDLLRAAEQGDLADRSVLRTDHQTSGRGRLDRRWDAPAGSNLLASMYLAEPGDQPGTALQRVGVAIIEALHGMRDKASELSAVASEGVSEGVSNEVSEAVSEEVSEGVSEEVSEGVSDELASSLGLKWPNDVLLDGRKLAGVLAQRSNTTPGLVVGFGVNVGWAPPDAARVSEILDCRPDELLVAVLDAFDALPAEAPAFAERYRGHLLTLGRRVRVHLPGDTSFDGLATDVETDGRIIVRSDAGTEQTFDVGDVVHLRPGPDDLSG